MTFDMESLKLRVKKLVLGCPLDFPLPGCPAEEFRGLEIAEKLDLVEMMAFDQLQDIVSHHEECLKDRRR